MNLFTDLKTFALVGGVLVLLGLATFAGQMLARQTDSRLSPALIRQFNRRIRAWWLMYSALALAFILPTNIPTVILFGGISFWALREFITLTPTRSADHRALFWVFFVFTPLQYVLVGGERYEVYSILIPVYAFLFIPARIAWAGDFKRFLERSAKIQAGLMICVYCLSYAPALLSLKFESQTAASETPVEAPAEDAATDAAKTEIVETGGNGEVQNYRLLFFLVLIVQMGDLFQQAWEKLLGRRLIAPAISTSKTWEGFLGGVGSATLLGTILWWATPFTPWQAAGMSFVITVMGAAGGLTMSAIKRDRGVKDYGTLIEGHGGVLDRIDTVCFAAPVFFHILRIFFAATA